MIFNSCCTHRTIHLQIYIYCQKQNSAATSNNRMLQVLKLGRNYWRQWERSTIAVKRIVTVFRIITRVMVLHKLSYTQNTHSIHSTCVYVCIEDFRNKSKVQLFDCSIRYSDTPMMNPCPSIKSKVVLYPANRYLHRSAICISIRVCRYVYLGSNAFLLLWSRHVYTYIYTCWYRPTDIILIVSNLELCTGHTFHVFYTCTHWYRPLYIYTGYLLIYIRKTYAKQSLVYIVKLHVIDSQLKCFSHSRYNCIHVCTFAIKPGTTRYHEQWSLFECYIRALTSVP